MFHSFPSFHCLKPRNSRMLGKYCALSAKHEEKSDDYLCGAFSPFGKCLRYSKISLATTVIITAN